MNRVLTDSKAVMPSMIDRIKSKLHRLKGSSLLRKSLLLAFLLYLSPIVGVVLEIAMIRMLGAGGVLDAFRVLTTFMMMGQGVITSQLLKYALVPQLAWFRHQDRDREGLLFALYFTGLVVAILSPVLFVGLFRPDYLLSWLAPGFSPELNAQAQDLVRVAAVGLIVLTMVGSMSAVMNFYGIFWGQPLGQVLSNLIILVSVIVLGGYATQAHAHFQLLEASVALGLMVTLSMQLWQCTRIWRSTRSGAGPVRMGEHFKLVLLMLVPQLMIIGSEIIKPLAVNRTLSQMAVGSIALYMLAFRLQMLGNLPAKALTTVLFPDMSRLRHGSSRDVLLARLRNGASQIFMLTALISLVLWLLADFIVTAIGALGKISPEQTEMVLSLYNVFLVFAPFGSMGLYCMETAFAYRLNGLVVIYSIGNTAAILWMLQAALEKGVIAVAMAYTLSQAICMLLLGAAVYLRIRWGKMEEAPPSA